MNKPIILVVDDEPLNIEIIDSIMGDSFELLVAYNGYDALRVMREKIPSLILLDLYMPKMDGFEVLRTMKSDEALTTIPVIIVTADKKDETLEKVYNEGASDYISKPFKAAELLARTKAHINLNKALQKNIALLGMLDESVEYMEIDTGGIIKKVSKKMLKVHNVAKEILIGRNIDIFKLGNGSVEHYKNLYSIITDGKTFETEIEDIVQEGKTYWYKISICHELTDENNIEKYLVFFESIDENKKLQKCATTDSLTQLPNRFKIDEILELEDKNFQRYHDSFSVILMDIDFFKKVNDVYGHNVGDTVLIEFAKILEQYTRSSDTVGRWGGEEFLAICPKTDLEGAVKLAELLRSTIEQHIFEKTTKQTASFGVAQYAKGDTLENLFARADKALYEAKENGRNQVKYLS